MAELPAICCKLHFTPKEIPWYSFLLEAELTSGLRATACKQNDYVTRKFQKIPLRIEARTSCLVAHCLNKLFHCSLPTQRSAKLNIPTAILIFSFHFMLFSYFIFHACFTIHSILSIILLAKEVLQSSSLPTHSYSINGF
jgi:hypothetical protein